jgi:hypothetical protein
MTFDRAGIKVYRFGEAAPDFTKRLGVPEFPGPEATALWRAWGGCVDNLRAEAFVPWSDVREIAAGNYVLWFRFNTPVTVTSDNRKQKALNEFKVALHGALGTVEYRQTPGSGENDRWWQDTRTLLDFSDWNGPTGIKAQLDARRCHAKDAAWRIWNVAGAMTLQWSTIESALRIQS